MKKILLVIIPGSKTKSIKILKPILDKFYKYFGVDLENNDYWTLDLKYRLQDRINVEVFNWEGGIFEKSIFLASKELIDLIKIKGDYDEIILFGKSLGGYVAEKVLKDDFISNKVSKLIYVGTPHKTKNKKFSKDLKIINIYSENDNYQKLATNTLYLGFGSQFVNGVNNINIFGLKHSDFNKDIDIIHEGKNYKLFDFYKEIILND